jgi:hypothetical protein
LLIEEQRVNLLLQSETFDNASWSKFNAAVTANAVVAPNGTLTADKLVETSGSSASAYVLSGVSITPVTYTFSVYAKASENSFLWLRVDALSFNRWAWVNVSNGTVGTAQSGLTVSTVSVGDGWYRCILTYTATATGNGSFYIGTSSADNVLNDNGDGTSGIFIWGAQLEAGAFPTSYIPTVASQVTRSADVAVIQGSNFSSFYNVNEGTLYGEARFIGRPASTGNARVAVISDGGTNNFISIGLRNHAGANNMYYGQILADGTTQAFLPTTPAADIGNNNSLKTSISYATNNVSASGNGSTADTDTLAVIPVVNRMFIGTINGAANSTNGHISQIAYYPRRLQNSELQAITS